MMSSQPLSFTAAPTRSPLRVACAVGAGVVGLVLLLYAVYFVPNQLADSSALGDSPSFIPIALVFLTMVGLLSMVGAVGYWLNKTWGWYFHLASTAGQLLLPGALFELKLDWYHMAGWLCPVLSLAMVILMGVETRRKKRVS